MSVNYFGRFFISEKHTQLFTDVGSNDWKTAHVAQVDLKRHLKLTHYVLLTSSGDNNIDQNWS